jgi:sec-independent protein translocase protein TatA
MEGLIILVLILLFFGARRVPQLGRSLGSGIREFRKETASAAPGAASDDDKGRLEQPDDGEEGDGTPRARRKPSVE